MLVTGLFATEGLPGVILLDGLSIGGELTSEDSLPDGLDLLGVEARKLEPRASYPRSMEVLRSFFDRFWPCLASLFQVPLPTIAAS